MILIDKEDVQNMLVETEDIPAYIFKQLDEKLDKIQPKAVIRDCDGCIGGSFNDCPKCEKFVISKGENNES